MLYAYMKIYTIKDLAEIFSVSELSVRRWISSGELTGFTVGQMWRFTESDIHVFIDKRRKADKNWELSDISLIDNDHVYSPEEASKFIPGRPKTNHTSTQYVLKLIKDGNLIAASETMQGRKQYKIKGSDLVEYISK